MLPTLGFLKWLGIFGGLFFSEIIPWDSLDISHQRVIEKRLFSRGKVANEYIFSSNACFHLCFDPLLCKNTKVRSLVWQILIGSRYLWMHGIYFIYSFQIIYYFNYAESSLWDFLEKRWTLGNFKVFVEIFTQIHWQLWLQIMNRCQYD